MCGRYTLTSKELTELEEFLNTVERDSSFSDTKASYSNYNVAPTHEMPVAYVDENGKRTLETMHWGNRFGPNVICSSKDNYTTYHEYNKAFI